MTTSHAPTGIVPRSNSVDSTIVSPARAGDTPHLLALIDAICVPRTRHGRPAAARITWLWTGPTSTSPPTARCGGCSKGSCGRALPAFGPEPNMVERCLGHLEQSRVLATRHAKPAACNRLTLLLATTIF